MTREEILAGITTVAREFLGLAGELRPEQRLVEDLELDSIRLLTLAAEIENRFRVILTPADEAAVATVDDLVSTVARKLAAADEAGQAGKTRDTGENRA